MTVWFYHSFQLLSAIKAVSGASVMSFEHYRRLNCDRANVYPQTLEMVSPELQDDLGPPYVVPVVYG